MSMNGNIIFSEGRIAGAARVEVFEVRRRPAYAQAPQVSVQVNLFTSPAGMASDQGLIWQEPLINVVPIEAFDPARPYESLEQWIIENVPMFADCEYSDGSPVAETLAAVQASRKEALNLGYARAIGALVEGYPKVEQASWPQQVEEARDLQADANAVTPWLTACAEARGITRAELAERVLALNTPYRAAHGRLTGVRQLAESQIDNATTPEEARAVAWSFGPDPLYTAVPAITPTPAPAPVSPSV